jgi:hypothetical protein
MRAMHRTIPLLAALLGISSAAIAQGPDQPWQTIATPHFRVHYPAAYAEWAERAASTLESVRAVVVNEVGFAPAQVTDVLIGNPLAVSNGMTLPLLDAPRIVLYAEPPPLESEIGEYATWIDLLSVHEMAHLIHLLRPSRNPMLKVIERLLPLNPITLSAPRWILEGYATVIEGRITGSGRPPSAIRAAVLREWAATGQFPSYSQLSGDRRFLGYSMPYLAGSAFLEWLENRRGPGTLRDLWSRMTARQRRSFDAAFEGVFGDSPRRLYGTFVADVTAAAISVNRANQPAQEGAVWQETTEASGDPAVSTDGKKLAIVIRSRTAPPKIVIWSTSPAIDEERKYRERIAKMIARDPEDVAPRHAMPVPRKPLHTYTAPDGRNLSTPRWLRDGSIVFSSRQPDRDGFLHHDLFRWDPESGRAVRITHHGDVFDADPAGDGNTAVAVRTRYGASQLIRVDLRTAAVTELTPSSIERVYSHPRVGSDGRIVASVHRDGDWHLDVFDARGTFQREIATSAASPEWMGDDIVATVFRDGFIDLHRFGSEGEAPLTRMTGGAFEPAPSPDGRVFFMSLEPDGFVLRVLDPATPLPPRPPVTAASPVVPPPRASAARFTRDEVTPRPYGIGRQELSTITSGNLSPSMHAYELGIRLGDVVGRLDTIALASIGDGDSPRGVALASAWRGWPVELRAHLYSVDELGMRERGGEVRGTSRAEFRLGSIDLSSGMLLADHSRRLGFVETASELRQVRGSVRMREEVAISGESGSGRRHARGRAAASIDFGRIAVGARYQRDRAWDGGTIEVGGLISSITPRSARAFRVRDPALPFRARTGDDYRGARVEATLGGLTIFGQEHRMGARLRLAGVEVAGSSPPVPLLKVPALDLTLGGAHVYDDPLRGRNRFWIGIRWEP